MNKVTILVAFALVGICSANVLNIGPCPSNIKVVDNFNIPKYLGTWYEFAKYPQPFEANGKCNTANYNALDDGTVGVRNELINTLTGAKEDIKGVATAVDNAKLVVTFPINDSVSNTGNYWVLDTDYVNYSVVYSCQPISKLIHSTSAWILTREREPSAEMILKAATVLNNNDVSLKDLVKTDQRDCTNKNSVTIKCSVV